MITHDVDEAILLADRIFLMTNGPQARIAEAVEIDLPRPRTRAEIVKHPHFFTLRNYLTEFLIERSHTLRESELDRRGLRYPKTVNPLAKATATASQGATAPNLINFTPKETRHG
jgi:nitrate/nitrite transport system ATP-binding protein